MGNQNPISSEAIEKQKEIAKAAEGKVLKSPQEAYAVKCNHPISKMFPVLIQKITLIKKQKNFQGVTHITESCPVYYLTALDCYYQGQWKDSMPNGCGIAVYKNLSYYQGDFEDSELKTTEGFYFFNNGSDKVQQKISEKIHEEDLLLEEKYKRTTSSYYIGNFQNSKFEGKGTISHKGIVYEGDWKNGVREGEGKQYSIGQNYSFHGKFVKGLKNGQGIYTRKINNKSFVYEGGFKSGNFHGIGKIHINDHIYYSGQFNQGEAQGKGQIYLRSVIYKGQFRKNLIKGEGELTYIQSQKGIIKGVFNQSVNEGKTKRQIFCNKQRLVTDEQYYQFPLIALQH